MKPETLSTIEQTATELFSRLGLSGQVKVAELEENSASVEVSVDTPQLYIGEKGQTMAEIQYVLKALLRRKLTEPVYVSLDINEYRKNKEHYLRELARTIADEVALLKTTKELPPMSAAERRIVHLELQERGDVVTESAGDGSERRVVIKLKENTPKAPAEPSDPG